MLQPVPEVDERLHGHACDLHDPARFADHELPEVDGRRFRGELGQCQQIPCPRGLFVKVTINGSQHRLFVFPADDEVQMRRANVLAAEKPHLADRHHSGDSWPHAKGSDPDQLVVLEHDHDPELSLFEIVPGPRVEPLPRQEDAVRRRLLQ